MDRRNFLTKLGILALSLPLVKTLVGKDLEMEGVLNKEVIEKHINKNGLICPICNQSLRKGCAYFTTYDAYRCPTHKHYLFCAKYSKKDSSFRVVIPTDIRHVKIPKEFQ